MGKIKFNNIKKHMSMLLLFIMIFSLFHPFLEVRAVENNELNESGYVIPVIRRETLTIEPSLKPKEGSKYTYIISSVEDLNKFREDIDNGYDYKGKIVELTQDIDLKKSNTKLNSFKSMVNELGEIDFGRFNGIFDGNGHTISNYNDPRSGLFSIIGPNSIIRNVNIDADVTIEDNLQCINLKIESHDHSRKFTRRTEYGLIANENSGTISRCSTSGDIVTKSNKIDIGGIVGSNDTFRYLKKDDKFKGYIYDCFSRIKYNDLSENGRFGGICGTKADNDKIKNCYFAGEVLGREISNKISPIILFNNRGNSCFFDIDMMKTDNFLLKQIGLTTDELKSGNKLEESGFNFEKVWELDKDGTQNDGYPYLSKEKLDKREIISLDVKGKVKDKNYNPDIEFNELLKGEYEGTEIVNIDEKTQKLIDEYGIKLVAEPKEVKFSPLVGEQEIDISYNDLYLDIEKRDQYDYIFRIGNILPAKATFNEIKYNKELKKEEKDEKIEKLKELEDYVVNTIRDRHGFLIKDIPEMSYERKKDQWGDNIILDDHDWFVFSAARMGYIPEENPEFYDDWFEEIQKFMAKLKEEGIDVDDIHADSISKLALAISATGYDIRDIEGWDLLGSLTKHGRQMSGYFSSQYSYFARHSQDYPMSKEIKEKDEKMIHDQAKFLKDRNGGSAADMVVMAYQPALYFNNVEGYEDVTEAVRLMKQAFSENQSAEGTFWGGFANDTHNIWTNAQVYMNINIAGLDPFDPMFIKNGNTIVEPYLKGEYFDFENKMLSPMITYEIGQIIRGFDSVVRTYEGRTHIFDCRDLEDTLGLKTSTVTVNNQILSLTENSTPEEVAAARDAYNGPGSKLTDRQRKSMRESTIKHLEDIEKKVIENPDKEAADRINKLIDKLKLDKFTNENKEAVKAARKAYEALTKDQKKLVDVVKLEEAEKKMDELEMKNFKSLVEAIGDISSPPTEENIKDVEKAENAYNNMSEELKKDSGVITAKAILDKAIEKINENSYDKEVESVINAIKALPKSITLEDKPAVEATRKSYDVLDSKQKEKVGAENLNILEEAERTIKELESEDEYLKTITFALERFTLGQGYFVEPIEVEIYEGENCRDILDRVVGKENVVGKYDYVEAIKGADKGEVNIPEELLSMIEENPTNGQSFHGELNEPGQLGEFDYSSMSGWMYSVNNVLPNVGMNAYTPKDGDVFRVHFTLWGYGADLGQDFPGGTPPLPVGDKTALTKKIAEINGKPNKDKLLKDPNFKEVYDYSYKTIQRVTVSDEELEECVKLLETSMKKADENIIKEVENMISKLPEIDKLTLNDKGKVEEVRKAYDELPEEQRKLVSNADKLIKAEDKIVKLEAIAKEKEKKDKEIADKVTKQIESLKLDKFTAESKEDVKAARKAYEALTDDQKKLVDVKKFEVAEKKIKELEIENFKDLVEDIGEISKPATKENIKSIERAENAYNNMSEELKKDVEVMKLKDILDEAKNKLDEDIVPDNEDDNKDPNEDNNKPPNIDPNDDDKTGGTNGKVIDINNKKKNIKDEGKSKLPATGTNDRVKYIGIAILLIGLLLLSKKHFKLAKNSYQDK